MMRQIAGFLGAALPLALLVASCGGSGGGGEAAPTTLYVRERGNDANRGDTPDTAFRSIARAVQGLSGGQTVIVGPGSYRVPGGLPTRFIDIEDVTDGPLTILADPSGEMTEDRADDVVVDAEGAAFAFRISRSSEVTIDGFAIRRARGDNGAGIQVRGDSSQITVKNCSITSSRDGIRVESSDDVLIFNNLIFANQTRGVRLSGVNGARLFHNTIADNGARGLSAGGSARQIEMRNNILQENGNRNIEIETDSLDAYDADWNLVFSRGFDATDTYSPSTIRGDNDVNADALFVNPSRNNYRLQDGSPAIDAGDGTIDPLLLSELFAQTTTPDDESDRPPIDLGRHVR
jgi:parallel beta-helix repeat protein